MSVNSMALLAHGYSLYFSSESSGRVYVFCAQKLQVVHFLRSGSHEFAGTACGTRAKCHLHCVRHHVAGIAWSAMSTACNFLGFVFVTNLGPTMEGLP